VAKKRITKNSSSDWDSVRDEWLKRLAELIDQVERWAKELGWATRRLEKQVEDSQCGVHAAPGLLLQKDFTKVMLEPIGPPAPGATPIVDMYLMPAYDDLASLYFSMEEGWRIQYFVPEKANVLPIDSLQLQARPFSKKALREVVEEMSSHAAKIQ
jgi:hypothetical protein